MRVLCVGMGETAADITLQISEVAASCTLSMRTFPEIIKRYRGPGRRTTDVNSTRLFHWMSLEQRKDFYAFKRKFRDTRKLSDHDRLVYEWNRKSGGCRSLQKNDDFVSNVIDERIQVLAPSELSCIEGNTVIFDDHSTLEVDAIVFCTGYEESSIPNNWIKDVEISDVRQLYKHAFHIDLGRRIAFFGWGRPRQGGVPVLSELLARYFALLRSGERELPAKSEMKRVIAEDCAREEEWFAQRPFDVASSTAPLDSDGQAPLPTPATSTKPPLHDALLARSCAGCRGRYSDRSHHETSGTSAVHGDGSDLYCIRKFFFHNEA